MPAALLCLKRSFVACAERSSFAPPEPCLSVSDKFSALSRHGLYTAAYTSFQNGQNTTIKTHFPTLPPGPPKPNPAPCTADARSYDQRGNPYPDPPPFPRWAKIDRSRGSLRMHSSSSPSSRAAGQDKKERSVRPARATEETMHLSPLSTPRGGVGKGQQNKKHTGSKAADERITIIRWEVRGVLVVYSHHLTHLTSWPLSRVITVAPLLSLDTFVTGAEGSAGMVLGDLAQTESANTHNTRSVVGRNKKQRASLVSREHEQLGSCVRAIYPHPRTDKSIRSRRDLERSVNCCDERDKRGRGPKPEKERGDTKEHRPFAVSQPVAGWRIDRPCHGVPSHNKDDDNLETYDTQGADRSAIRRKPPLGAYLGRCFWCGRKPARKAWNHTTPSLPPACFLAFRDVGVVLHGTA